jgi:hypothetical protein
MLLDFKVPLWGYILYAKPEDHDVVHSLRRQYAGRNIYVVLQTQDSIVV